MSRRDVPKQAGSMGRLGAGLLLALVVTVLLAGPSWAHSQLVATDPADKSKISVVPGAVTMTFNENMLGLGTRVQVTGPGGDVTSGATTVTDNVVRQPIASDAPAGKYTVLWKVTSGDGHPVSGQFSFAAAAAAGAPTASSSPAEAVAPTTDTPTPTPSVVGLPASSSSPSDTGSTTSSLVVLGAGVVLLVALILIFAAISRIWRSRSVPPRDR